MPRPKEVFLSHSSADSAMAARIAEVLNRHGVPTFYSPSNIAGAQQWQHEILDALDRCDWFSVLLTPDAVQSMWVQRETAYALQDPRYAERIIPLLYRDCDLGPLRWLRLSQRLDFRSDFDDGCRELLRIWGLGLR
jgi:hypothetical protein